MLDCRAMRFVCVLDGSPEESGRLLEEACAARGIAFVPVDAPTFDWDESRRLAPGDLLFRVSGTPAAANVERFLFSDGVSTIYADPARVFVDVTSHRLTLSRAGVPVPPTICCATSERGTLERYVARLGGFPLVANLGSEGGRGTIRLDSAEAFYATMEFCDDHGLLPELSAFIPQALHWRVVVVGGRAVACYPNPVKPGDFRSEPSTEPADYSSVVDAGLAALAVRATAALGVDFAGVDILRAPGHPDCVLEANVPCYFPKAQVMAGIDVAGAIVESLAAKVASGGTM